MKNQRWFDQMRRSLEQLGIESIDVNSVVPSNRLTLDVLTFGHRLGVLSAEAVIAIELRKLKEGAALNQAEESIALSLSVETRDVEDALEARFDETPDSPLVCRVWQLAIVARLRQRWNTVGDPDVELNEFLAEWGDDGAFTTSSLAPSGFDKYFAGKGARIRFLKRIDELLLAEFHDLQEVH